MLFNPTQDQMQVVTSLSKFTTAVVRNKTLVVKGYAGTGKTYLISAYVQALKDLEKEFVLLAPTGRAAKVLSRYCNHAAYTIHRHIYRQKGTSDFDAFQLGYNKLKDTIFIIDEASMISNNYQEGSFGSGYLMKDLMDYIFSGDG
ncbi:MAG: AAA family ATPase, partial [Bacteroidales bacterium]|nr:AAA family ATPase [Bacteroidales bacterium]